MLEQDHGKTCQAGVRGEEGAPSTPMPRKKASKVIFHGSARTKHSFHSGRV